MNQSDDSASAKHRPAPLRHALVATDFSVGAAAAIARAGRLPLADGGRITIIHVVSDRIPRRARAKAETLARRELDQSAKHLRRAAAAAGRRDLEISSEQSQGQPYVEIVRRARVVRADLVVLGRHGRRPVKALVIGSTVERVIRSGDLPVLVVGRKASHGYRRPLIAVDREDSFAAVVALALRVVGPDTTALTMLHAYEVPFEGIIAPSAAPGEMTALRKECAQNAASDLLKLQASLGDVGVAWRTIVARGDPRTVILVQSIRRRADLIALGTHGRSGLSHVLLGSVAEWVVRAAACDVLVARPARVSFALP